MIELLLAASATALATGLGVIPVSLLGTRAETLRPAMLGVASGVMAVASVAGLLEPALDEGSVAEVGVGALAGLGFLLVARRAIEARIEQGRTRASSRLWLLVFAVLVVHSLPEGFAIGTAYASSTEGLGLFIVVAIAVQNVPEGTSVAIPMAQAGASGGRQFWAAVATSLPQPAGAAIAYVLVEEVTALLPISFGFAAGAMLALVAVEMLPPALRSNPAGASAGAIVGGAGMLALSILLGV
jgi:ZIP family zinc transporter